ncbi:hypothetical protein ACE1CD_14055 [Aerosakkonema sp. BLCC-F183]|uniref:hypothetical protein n=1 Tax=Aerosakkonema sp. BLCC-F183 TaxID=3342834 RepID=UPI0035B6AF6D
MSENVMVNCQIPQDWKRQIEQIAAQRKKQSAQIIYEAIAQYLGEDIQTVDNRLLALEKEMPTLQKEITQLNATVKSLQERLHAATSTIAISDPASVNLIKKVQQEYIYSDENFPDDEPDEILYGFLEPEDR